MYNYRLAQALLATAIFSVSGIVAQEASLAAASTNSSAPAAQFGWKKQFNGLLNLSQTYQDNWVKGGTDALAWEINLNGSAIQDEKDFTWESKGKVTYGRTKIQEMASRKSSDEWIIETIYTRKLGTWVNPFAAAKGQSQFTLGYAYNDSARTRKAISDFFDPAYFTQTLGLGITPIKDLTERLGATMKQTISDFHRYADDKKTKSKIEALKQEYGLSSTTEYKFELMQNIQAATQLDIFVNFKGWDEVDGRWDNRIIAKVNKFVNVNFSLEYLYDKDLSDSKQMREGLSVGISFLSL